MNPAEEKRIEPAVVAELYSEHERELRSFLLGVLRDRELAAEVLQATFAKAIEVGHRVVKESLKGWLFRVALNEALAVRRRLQVHDKVMQRVAWEAVAEEDSPLDEASRREMAEVVRSALANLPAEQQQVVSMRIYEGKTFARIAGDLGVPLGTVLTRMQLAIRKLRERLSR